MNTGEPIAFCPQCNSCASQRKLHRMSKGKASSFAAESNAVFIILSLCSAWFSRAQWEWFLFLSFPSSFLCFCSTSFLASLLFFILLLPAIPNPASTASWLHFHSSPSAKVYYHIMYQMLTFIIVSIRFWVKAWMETSSLCSVYLSSVSFQTIFRLKKGNATQLGPTRKISWTTMMDRSIFCSLIEV